MLRSRAHSNEHKPTTRCQFVRGSSFSPAFLHSLQPHHNLCTIFAALHHYLYCTSLQIYCISPQSLLHLTTGPHHNLCCTSPRSLLRLTTDLPHHDLCCTSPRTSLHPQSLMAYRNTTPALQKLVALSSN